jgi:hypothetical protein
MCVVRQSWRLLSRPEFNANPIYTGEVAAVSVGAGKVSNLTGMNWRRGILLAGIHLAVAVPLIIILEVRPRCAMTAMTTRRPLGLRAIRQ